MGELLGKVKMLCKFLAREGDKNRFIPDIGRTDWPAPGLDDTRLS